MANCAGRHLALKEIGKKNLKLLANKKIFVVGAGGLGNPLVLYLSRFGLKQITIVDFDVVEDSNLERQILFDKNDKNKAKAIVSYNKTKQFTKTRAIVDCIESIDNNKVMLSDFKASDIIIDCTDAPCAKEFIYKLSKKYKKPLVYGTVIGTKGYVSLIYPNDKKVSMLYKKTPEKINARGVYSLAVGVIALLQANLCIKCLLKEDKNLRNKLYYFDVWHMDLKELRF